MKFILYISFILLVVSCSDTGEKKMNSNNEVVREDTAIQLLINSKPQQFTAKKSNLKNLREFQKFLSDYASKPLTWSDTENVDVTGDGMNERVITRIENRGSDCFITARIFSGKKMVYTDTLKLDDEYTYSQGWNYDSIYFRLKPYSNFYEGLFNKNILDDLDTNKASLDSYAEMFFSNLADDLKCRGLDSVSVKKKQSAWRYRLEHFKGKLVYTMHQMDRDVLIWDEEKKEFILFYSP